MVRVSPVNRIRLPAIAVSGGSGPALTVNQFQQISGAPLNAPVIGNEWSSGQSRFIYDETTGDLLLIFGNDSNTTTALYTSQDKGQSWASLGTQTLSAGAPSQVLSVAQDASGEVHCLGYQIASPHNCYYWRLALTRSGGHVTGFAVVQAPFSLPAHSTVNSTDPRGNIHVFTIGGVERLVWCYNAAATEGSNTDLKVYGGRSTSLTPSSASDFVAFDGAAGDSLLYQHTGDQIRTMHYIQCLMAQDGSTEDVYLFLGYVDADHRTTFSYNAGYNLEAIRYTVSGGSLVQGSTTVVAEINGVPPQLMSASSTTGKAWVMYIHPTNGVSFATFTGGAVTNAAITALDVGNRAAVGAMSADDTGRVWCAYHTYSDNSNQQIHGELAYWDGTEWSKTTITDLQDCCGFGGVANWKQGVAVIRWTGAMLPGQNTSVHTASIHGP